jgi:glutamate racemase
MLKIVVFDGGCGGELFADRLASELPVVEIIKVIDRYSAETILTQPRKARIAAENALRPYFGQVDLIIFANYLLSITSLNYFRKKYKTQKFIGFTLRSKRLVVEKATLILTTTATTKNFAFFTLAHRIKAKTICLDSWPLKIDSGELTKDNIGSALGSILGKLRNFSPEQVLLICGQFTEFIPEFRKAFGHNVRIVDSFDDTIRDAYRVLKIRGAPKPK